MRSGGNIGGDSATGWLNSEVAPLLDVAVAVKEAGIAASPDPSTVSAKLACPFASDAAAASLMPLLVPTVDHATLSGPKPRAPSACKAQMVSRCAADKAGDAQIFTYCRAGVSGYQLV